MSSHITSNPCPGLTLILFCCRGYAFITFTNKAEAEEAVKQVQCIAVRSGQATQKLVFQLNSLEITRNNQLKVNISVPNNTRLFIGNIPKLVTRAEISQEVKQHSCKFLKAFSLA